MSRLETELIGGGLDGRRIWLDRSHPFVWVDSDARGGVFSIPGPDRHLYRKQASYYVYAGNTHAMCPGCGAYVERINGHNRSCSLCGSALARSEPAR